MKYNTWRLKRPRSPWAVSHFFSDFNVHMKLLGCSLRCRLRFCGPRWDLRHCISNKLPGEAMPRASHVWLEWERFGSELTHSWQPLHTEKNTGFQDSEKHRRHHHIRIHTIYSTTVTCQAHSQPLTYITSSNPQHSLVRNSSIITPTYKCRHSTGVAQVWIPARLWNMSPTT